MENQFLTFARLAVGVARRTVPFRLNKYATIRQHHREAFWGKGLRNPDICLAQERAIDGSCGVV
jgi:hypothetical protein